MEQFDHRSRSAPPDRSRVWVPCAIAFVAVTAGGIVLLGLRVANHGPEPAGQNWWLVTWFCVGLAYSVVGAALVARSSRRNLGVCFLVVGWFGHRERARHPVPRVRLDRGIVTRGLRRSPRRRSGRVRSVRRCSSRS